MPIPVGLTITSFDPGGTERQTAELVNRLNPEQFSVHVVCLRREGLWLPQVERTATSVTEFRLKGFRSLSTVTRLSEFALWCRKNDIAVLQACDLYANIFTLPGAALARVPVRIGSRRDILLPQRSAGQHRLQRYAYRFAHRIVTNSRAAANQVRKEGVEEARITTIPNGIDISAFAERRGPVRSGVITTVANLRPEKGHDTLIDAAARVVRQAPDVRFQIVGDGEMRQVLEEQVRTLGLQRQVTFLGHREDVAALLAASELFVLPSRTEAFPNSLVEAMAMGVPSIATRVGGIPELVNDGDNGVLIPVGDPGALADAILRLLDDNGRALGIGTAARATIASRYSFDRMVAGFEQLYLDELARRAPTVLSRAGLDSASRRGTSLAERQPMLPGASDSNLNYTDAARVTPSRIEKVS